MKLKKNINWKHKPKFLKIKLLKSQIYKNISYNSQFLKIENTEYRIKKILHIIHQFHINNKTILFLGIPKNLNNEMIKLFNKTRHNFIPQDIWINGTITNQVNFYLFKKKSDLIIIFNENNNEPILKEAYMSKKLIITLSSNPNNMNYKPILKILGNFNFTTTKLENSFLYLIIKTILKKNI